VFVFLDDNNNNNNNNDDKVQWINSLLTPWLQWQWQVVQRYAAVHSGARTVLW
jgi:hypothetical protein